MTRRERIVFLLENYADVVHGLRDQGSAGEHLPLMCRAWNRPGYQELERLVPELRVGAPRGYRAFVGIYVYPRQVRRALCPKCGHVAPPAMIGELHRHRHGKRAGAYVARMLRVPLFPVPEADVEELVDSMCDNWRGEPFVPDDLLPLVAVA